MPIANEKGQLIETVCTQVCCSSMCLVGVVFLGGFLGAVYPSFEEEDLDTGGSKKDRRRSEEDDDLWKPEGGPHNMHTHLYTHVHTHNMCTHTFTDGFDVLKYVYIFIGPVRLMKGSVASTSRTKRNSRKRSFDKSLSATSTKMTRVVEDTEEETKTTVSYIIQNFKF